MSVKLLAIAASVRPASYNKALLAIAVEQAKAHGAEVTEIDYRTLETPVYHGEHQGPLPAGAARLAEAVRAHDGILLASPEYNWSVPGALKNLIDWLSVDSAAPFRGRTALLMCATPSIRGGISGLQHLQVPLEVLGSWVYPQLIGIGEAAQQIQNGRIVREKDQLHLEECVRDFVRATHALRDVS